MSTKAEQRKDAKPENFWHRASPPAHVGQGEFRAHVIRNDKRDILTIDSEILDVTWTDASAPPTATVTMSHLENEREIGPGHLLVLEHRSVPSATYREVWRMRVVSPETTLSSKQTSYELEEDSTYFARDKRHWKYGKSKKHPHGQRLQDIITDAARKMGVRIGRMYPMRHRVKSLKVYGSLLDLIIKCLKIERESGSGHRIIWQFRGGKLEILPLRRSETLLLFGKQITEAAYKQSMKDKGAFATSITVRGTLKHKDGKGRKKFHVKVNDQAGIRRYGRIHKEITAPKGTDSLVEARKFARRELLRRRKLKQEVSFTAPGIPTLRRWDAVRVYLPEVRLNMLAYVNEVTHTASAGTYTMDVTLRMTDPYLDPEYEKKRLKRCKRLQHRKRKLSADCKKRLREDRKQHKKSTQRS